MRKRAAGVTLVELMVTLAVLAILVSVGYPMYSAQVLKAHRADARAGVMALAMAEEREFAAWGGYTESPAAITGVSFADGSPVPDANSTFNNDVTRIGQEYGQYYAFAVNATDSTFTITANYTGSQTDDTACASFTVDQTGVKLAKNSGNSDNTDLCW